MLETINLNLLPERWSFLNISYIFFHREVCRIEKRNISSERYQIQRWLSKNAMIHVPFNLEKRGAILFRDEITVPLFIIRKTLEGYKPREKFCRIVLIRSFGERITRYETFRGSLSFEIKREDRKKKSMRQ